MFCWENGCRSFCPTFARAEAMLRGGRVNTEERTFRMSTAKRTTMNKMNRERDIKEKRALKQERKAEKKLAAAAAAVIDAGAATAAPSV